MKNNKIAYFDGLRGLAALIVVIAHFIQLFYPALFSLDAQLVHNMVELEISKTPFNILYNGNLSVCIFFVLSGFVLSYRFFETKQSKVIISSAIRRYFRLALPVSVSVLFVYILLLFDSFYLKNILEYTFTQLNTDYSKFSTNFFVMSKIALFDTLFNWDSSYNPVLWTITYELFGSFLVFSFLALFGDIQRRYVVYILLIVLFSRTYFLGFIFGILLSDVFVHQRSVFQNLHVLVKYVLLFVGLFLGSYPYINTSNTIYSFLYIPALEADNLIVYHIVGAFLIMITVLCSSTLQSILSSSFFLFLGRISFSLYLIHFTLLCSLSSFLFWKLHAVIGYNSSALLTFLVSIPVMFVFSHYLYKYVDVKAINWSKELFEKKIFSFKN